MYVVIWSMWIENSQIRNGRRRDTLYDIVILFKDIASHHVGFSHTAYEADIGLALNKVMTEIDRIAVSTLKSITLTTLLKKWSASPLRGHTFDSSVMSPASLLGSFSLKD